MKFIKKLFKIALLMLGLSLVMTSCKSDIEKYWEIMREAADSPITETTTPDGLSFNMNENEYKSFIDSLPQKELDYRTYWPLVVKDDVFAAEFSDSKFYEGKLCGYKIWIDNRIANDTLAHLYPDDVKSIV